MYLVQQVVLEALKKMGGFYFFIFYGLTISCVYM